MKGGTNKDYSEELNSRMDACGVSPRLKDYIFRCVDLHSYPAPGVLIGAFMVDYALELLTLHRMKNFTRSARPRNAPRMQSRQSPAAPQATTGSASSRSASSPLP